MNQVIEEDRVRMGTRAKRLMDAIKITARNLFYQELASFKEAYDNYRDVHDLLTVPEGASAEFTQPSSRARKEFRLPSTAPGQFRKQPSRLWFRRGH